MQQPPPPSSPDSSRTFRPILPLPLGSRRPSEGIGRRKRQVVPAACEHCRARKIKCSAERPKCAECARRDIPCIYETTGAESHAEARKRKLDDLQTRNDVYAELVTFLRDRPAEEAGAILQRIRRGEPPESVVRHVRDGDLLLQLAVTPETRYSYVFPLVKDIPASVLGSEGNLYRHSQVFEKTLAVGSPIQRVWEEQAKLDERARMYLIPFYAVKLVEHRIDGVRAARWTSVTSDDQLVRQLLREYLKLEYPFTTIFPAVYFLEDMAAGRKRFCSSLLVNAVLASACHGPQSMHSRADFWDPKTLGYRFLCEARRLWDLEKSSNSITTVQAAIVLASTFNSNGVDKVGDEYDAVGTQMAVQMGLFDSLSHLQSRKARIVYTVTAWGVFGWHVMSHFHLLKEPTLNRPPYEPLPSYNQAAAEFGEVYVHYPLSQEITPLHHARVFRAICEFRTIQLDLARCLFHDKPNRPLELDEAMSYRRRFGVWFHGLPSCLTPEEIVLPSHLKIHMNYHNVMILLFEPFVSQRANEAGAVRHSTQRRPDDEPAPEEIIRDSKVCLEMLIRLYYLRHGFEHWDSILVYYLAKQASVSLANLREAGSSEDRIFPLSTLFLVMKGLYEQGKSSYLAEIAYHAVRAQIEPSDARLLENEMTELVEDLDRRRLIDKQAATDWPMQILNLTEDPETYKMKSIIKSFGNTNISDEETGSAGSPGQMEGSASGSAAGGPSAAPSASQGSRSVSP